MDILEEYKKFLAPSRSQVASRRPGPVIPPTPQQLYAINMIKTYLDIKFEGNDKRDAIVFIGQHYEKAKRTKGRRKNGYLNR